MFLWSSNLGGIHTKKFFIQKNLRTLAFTPQCTRNVQVHDFVYIHYWELISLFIFEFMFKQTLEIKCPTNIIS